MNEVCEKMITDMREIREGVLDHGAHVVETREGVLSHGAGVVEVERVTIALTRVCMTGEKHHAVTCSVTSSVTDEGSRTVGVTDVKDLHEAVWAFADRAEGVGAHGAGVAWEIETALANKRGNSRCF